MNDEANFQRMRNDHAQVLDGIAALERLVAAPDELTRSDELVRDEVAFLTHQFSTHMRAEDRVLFPALVEAMPEAWAVVAPLAEEHEELRRMLAALQNTVARERSPDRDEQLAVEIRDIVDLLRNHIRKEEAVVLRVAERTLAPPELRRIARRFEDAEPPSERK
jgi:hemerythrin-like domain-containing protein